MIAMPVRAVTAADCRAGRRWAGAAEPAAVAGPAGAGAAGVDDCRSAAADAAFEVTRSPAASIVPNSKAVRMEAV
jgi:hypothetical protein